MGYKIDENIRVFKYVYEHLDDYGLADYKTSPAKRNRLKVLLEYGDDNTRLIGVVADPDACDEQLYKVMGEYWSKLAFDQDSRKNPVLRLMKHENEMRFGLDFANGWKAVYDVYKGDPKWIDEYAALRRRYEGHLAFPRYQDNLNITRYGTLGDCMDSTLADIKLMFKLRETGGDWEQAVTEQCVLGEAMVKKSYEGQPDGSYIYISKSLVMFDEFESFKDYVKEMKLGCFMLDGKEKVRDLHVKGNKEYDLANYKTPPGFGKVYWKNLQNLLLSEGTSLPLLD